MRRTQYLAPTASTKSQVITRWTASTGSDYSCTTVPVADSLDRKRARALPTLGGVEPVTSVTTMTAHMTS
jgi:hypothetical protein